MPDIFDQVQYQPPQQQGDIFDQVQYQPPQQQMAVAPAQQQPDIFDQIEYQPQQQAPQPVPTAQPSQAAPLPAPQPGQPLQGGVQENWFQSLPIVKDFGAAQRAGDWGGAAGSFVQGIPAGPMEMVDMGTAATRWMQDMAADMAIKSQVGNLPPMVQDLLRQAAKAEVEQSPVRVPQTNFAEDFKNLVKPKYPGMFGGGAFAGQALVPVGTVGKGASLAEKLVTGALGGGAMSGLYDVGTQYRDTGHVNPLQTAGSVALGTGIGGLGAGAVHGIEKVLGGLASRFLPQAAPQQGRFQPGQLGQGLDAQAQQELAALSQQAAQEAPVMQGMRDLVKEAELSNFFGGREAPAPAPVPRAATPEEALARMESMTSGGAKSSKAQPDVIDVAKAKDDLVNTLRGAANQNDLDTLSEQATRWVQKNFSNAEVKKAMHREIAIQRKSRAAEFEGEAPKLDSAVEKVQNPPSPEESAPALKEWAKEALGEELDDALAPPPREMGDFRRTISDDMKGRNKVRLAVNVHENEVFNKRPVKLMLRKFGDAKVAKDYAEKRLSNFVKRYKDQFRLHDKEGSFDMPGGGSLIGKIDQSLSIAQEKAADAAFERFATGVDKTRRPVISGMLGKRFGSGGDQIPYTKAEMPESIEEASAVLRKLYTDFKAAEKAYEKLKPGYWEKEVERLESKLGKKQILVEEGASKKTREGARAALPEIEREIEAAKQSLKSAISDEDLLKSLEKDFAAHVGDETAPVNIKTMVPHPEEWHGNVEFALEYRKGTQQKIVPPENAESYAEAMQVIKSMDSNRPRKIKWSVDGNSMRKFMPAIAGGAAVSQFFGGQAAHAAEIVPKAAAQGFDFVAAWNSQPMTEALAGAVLLHKLAPKVAKAVLNEENWVGANWWKNTLDHVDYLERTGVLQPGLKNTILNHTAQTLKASWGISFDEDAKALGMYYLKEGLVTPTEIVSGSSKRSGALQTKEHLDALAHFNGMDSAQKNALAAYKIAQDSLKRHINDQIKLVDDWKAKNLPAGSPARKVAAVDESLGALRYMAETLGPRGKAYNAADRLAAKIRANFMDSAFFWNPAFHATNFTDSFIAGGSMTGPLNILRAWKLMASDKEIRGLYKDANLIGGYKAERVQDGVILKESQGFSLFPKADLQSDMVNANRVSLSSLLQYQQRNKAALMQAGWNGSDVDFAKALLKGDQSLPPELAADAWVHMTGTLSEALGVDTFRLNSDILSRSEFGRQAGIFFKQPARLSRLAVKYLADGDFRSFYTMVGYAAVFGGAAAAIPSEGEMAGQVLNPESYFKAADAADKLDLYEKASGKKLGPKLKWGFLWALQAGNNPVLQQPQEALGGMLDASIKRDPNAFMKAALKAVPLAVPRVAGIPTRMLTQGWRTANEIKEGQFKSFPQGDPLTKKPDFKEAITIPFAKIQRSPITHWLHQFMPGVESERYDHQMFYNESKARKGSKQMVPPANQYYSRADIYENRSPLDLFFGGIAR